MERFRGVMGVLLQSKVPLSVSSLSELCSLEYTPDILDSVLTPLSSLLAGVDRPSDPIRFLHTSFRDFLNKNKLSDANNSFYVDSSIAIHAFAMRCLRSMQELRFNICEVKTSYVRNDDPERIRKNIPFHLSYSCQFWASHLKTAHCNINLVHMVHETLYVRFLYWLEVLSLIKSSQASESLLFVKEWGEITARDDLNESREKLRDILDFIEDALQFIGAFATPIFQSAPHIYISALPSAPTTSIISKTFLSQFKNVLAFATGESQHWPALQNVLKVTDSYYIDAIGLPDGKHFIISAGTTLSVWDVETCTILKELEHSSKSKVVSMAASQDSKFVVSTTRDEIYVWNLESMTPQVRVKLSQDWISEDVSISHDGTYIASTGHCRRSERFEIHVWDARTGDAVPGPFATSTAFIGPIVFSHDHSKLYSACQQSDGKRVIRVWDVETASSELLKLEGHNDPVMISSPLALSPDGRRLAFCPDSPDDNEIVIYNIEGRNHSVGPFGDHDGGPVLYLVFSQTSQRIASGTDFGFRVWDARTGCMLAGPFETDSMYSSFAFLGETKILKCSFGTVQIWNAENGGSSEPYDGHTKGISSVEFSSSGDQIFSSGDDDTIRLWNAKTGRACWTQSDMGGSTLASFSPDDGHVVSMSGNSGTFNTLKIWNTTHNSTLQPVEIPLDFLSANLKPRFSRDGKFVTAVFQSDPAHRCYYTLGVWDAITGSPVSGSLTHPFRSEFTMDQIDFWDGELIAGQNGNTAYIYDTEKGTVTTKTFEFEGRWQITLSRDHRYLAVNGHHDVGIWDVETGNDIGLKLDMSVECLTFSPNGRFLVAGMTDGTLLVWDVKSNFAAKPLSLKGHTCTESVAFSQDSRYLVSGGFDGMIRVWDVSDLRDENRERIIAEGLPEFRDDSELVDGWVHGPKEELLLWVPSWNRDGLYRPRNTLVIGKGANKLNFTRFAHGEDWHKCYTGACK